MSRIRTIMITVMTGLTRFFGDDRMIHYRIGEGTARIRMAINTINFSAAAI